MTGASLRDRAGGPTDLSRSASQPEALIPSAFIEPDWPLNRRHTRLPKWAQKEIHGLLCESINREMDGDLCAAVRHYAKLVTGGNSAFVDDDVRLLAHLAMRAVDAGLTSGIKCPHTLRQIKVAAEKRRIAKGAAA